MILNNIDSCTPELIELLNLTLQETILLKSLDDFYKNNDNFNIFKSIIDGNNKISRRTIEYFVTKYSSPKCKNIKINIDNNTISFNVYSSYKDQLKSYKKKYFDPFGRGDRIPFFSNEECIITTIGQLNFYRWFISKKIYNYCYNNYDDIQKSLINSSNNINKPIIKKETVKNYYINNNDSLSVSFGI